MIATRKNAETELFIDVFFTNVIRGRTPSIGDNRNWWIDGRDTGVLAAGSTPSIGANRNWWINGRDTGVLARGKDGNTPAIGDNGNWIIGGADTGIATNGIPAGIIVMWSGSPGNIPRGWQLCDGKGVLSNGTTVPDLRGRFIVGLDGRKTEDGGDPDYMFIRSQGGSRTVRLEEGEMPAHRHLNGMTTLDPDRAFRFGYEMLEMGVEMDRGPWQKPIYTGYTTNAGGNQPHENRPPYYVLAYIIKL